MKELCVYIEIKGIPQIAGSIVGNDYRDAVFCYDSTYLEFPGARAISVSLPLQKDTFSVRQTRCFFEGLLPEGFSRRALANWARVNEEDYLSIVEKLGQECLGAILIIEKGKQWDEGEYKKLSKAEVRKLAAEGATKTTAILMETHLSLTGASGKVGLYYDEPNDAWYLPTGKLASTHIVKQSHIRLKGIVVNEQFCMRVAKKLGMDIPDTFIVDMGNGNDDEVLFATKRYDRQLDTDPEAKNLPRPYRLHQEDFCQALGIFAADKYEHENESYMKRMFELVRNVSSNPLEDQIKLWDWIVVNYLLGNTDCHLKNYSILYSYDMKQIRLSPAYDIVCTIAYESTKDMSFYIGGELDIRDITRDSFERAAKEIGIGHKLAMQHFDELASKFMPVVNETADEMMKEGYLEADRIRKVLSKWRQ